jgi:hypothetical protein
VKLAFLVEVEMKVSVFADSMPKNVVRNARAKNGSRFWPNVGTHKMSARARR